MTRSSSAGIAGFKRTGGNGSAIQNCFENHAGSRAGKSRCAGGHFVENSAEREEIGAAIELAAANLLWRHVGDSANGGAGAGEQIVRSDQAGGNGGAFGDFLTGRRQLGEAEVHNLRVAACCDEKIGGLDVAMDDAGGMSGVETVDNLDAPVGKRFVFEGTA